MRIGKWRRAAREVIAAALAEAQEAGIRGRALRKAVNAHYPKYCDTRKKYPYRVWREERDSALFKVQYGLQQLTLKDLQDFTADAELDF